MTAFVIPLTDEEKQLLIAINFDPPAGSPELHTANGDEVVGLMYSLLDREAIPIHRIRWFTDPEYDPGGRGSSRERIFERNGTSGESIFRHGNFLKHLRYFLFGPALPSDLMDRFTRAAVECGNVTSGDIGPLSRFARTLARSQHVEGDAAEDRVGRPDYALRHRIRERFLQELEDPGLRFAPSIRPSCRTP